MAINIDSFLKTVEDQTKTLAQQQFKQYTQQALADINGSLQDGRDDFERWMGELARGEINKEDFESLVRGELSLEKMEALKQAGLAEVRIQSLVNGVVDIVVNAALAAIP
jgi:hypothetical protein